MSEPSPPILESTDQLSVNITKLVTLDDVVEFLDAQSTRIPGHTITDDGVELTTRSTLDFVGVDVIDDPDNDRLRVSIGTIQGVQGLTGTGTQGVQGLTGIQGVFNVSAVSSDSDNLLALGTDDLAYVSPSFTGAILANLTNVAINGTRYVHELSGNQAITVAYSSTHPDLDFSIIHVIQPATGATFDVTLPAGSLVGTWNFGQANGDINEIVVEAPVQGKAVFTCQTLTLVQ